MKRAFLAKKSSKLRLGCSLKKKEEERKKEDKVPIKKKKREIERL